ncbi:hypothetical protein ICM_06470 [Bacillus cereus BAG1X2-3]|uniref:Rap family tetratricopeptide repeat protein n=1 Tax=Bacillus cereus TaxID=1396 RepID=UPI0003309AC7|nr:Rap family tetratricopeptide repeat protein [Bacillus cereus]EOO24713.1 hypothetical protein ICC_05145 [Bacillus cereus BAG1X1-1]EOO43067.1 hypothetical protein ICI_06069 [Bacillus cereus BAG1X2-1]EOO46424.1 hypothetical protein ICK_05375 [Bacillus cereus BAG1X2-2]EOO61959.1 hypothetical protein ICM_06470 [Bacillus cereus BAG1X2-3]EOP01389.1 hypothetical protein ICO_05542 [Bacillus cereus BAG2O-1]
MNVHIQGNEQITHLLNEWYQEIRARHVDAAQLLKQEIENKIHDIEENQTILLYYSLLDFRHQYLIDSLSISKDSFKQSDAYKTPTDDFLSYYYHFFKAIHSNVTGNHSLAKIHYDKAEYLLETIPDEIEHAEFHYELAIFYCHTHKSILCINHVMKAKDIFSKHPGYELKVAFCNNLYGLACTHLKEWELAEEHFISAMDTFQKENLEYNILIVRHNLGFMYATQNLSEVALRYLSEVNQKLPSDYKAVFIEAREHYKLGEHQIAQELIKKGLQLSTQLGIEGYIHHFKILEKMNLNSCATDIEKTILEGISYFEREELYEYINEYTEKLAVQFYKENNHKKASYYFYEASKASEKNFKKGALK